jgi:hypothetical protein
MAYPEYGPQQLTGSASAKGYNQLRIKVAHEDAPRPRPTRIEFHHQAGLAGYLRIHKISFLPASSDRQHVRTTVNLIAVVSVVERVRTI